MMKRYEIQTDDTLVQVFVTLKDHEADVARYREALAGGNEMRAVFGGTKVRESTWRRWDAAVEALAPKESDHG